MYSGELLTELEVVWAVHSHTSQAFAEHLHGAKDSGGFADVASHWTGSGWAGDQAPFQMVAEGLVTVTLLANCFEHLLYAACGSKSIHVSLH